MRTLRPAAPVPGAGAVTARSAHRAALLLALLTALLVTAAPAGAASYRSPGYKGTRVAPKTTPAPAPAPRQIGSGEKPQVLVDAAGTAHVVWNERRGDDADAVHYCRIKRGETGCDTQSLLVPNGPGDGRESPLFNSEIGTPRVFAVGDQVAIITHRYPNPVLAPNGQIEERNTWLFVSNDGGQTFSPGVLVGTNEDTGDPTVFGPAASPRIGLISDTQTGGPFFQQITGGRYETRQADLGDDGVSTSLAPVGDSVMMATGDLHDTIHLRQWTGNGDIEDPTTWSETTTPGDDPRLVGGPKGLFLMSRPPAGQDRRYTIRPVAPGGAVGAAVPLPDTQSASQRDLFEDAAGRLHASYVVADGDGMDQLRQITSGDGRSWSAAQLVQQATGDARILDTDLAGAADGGGFLISQQGPTPGVEGPILASIVGTRSPTGKVGLGGVPGVPQDPDVVDTCQKLSFDAVDVQATEGCLLGSTSRNLKVSEGTVRLNGLDIVPHAGVKIVFDTKAKTINTTGTVSVVARAPGIPDITLYKGELHIDLKLEAKDLLADDPSSPCKGKRLASLTGDVDLLGFPIKGGVQVFLTDDAACIPLNLELPKAFGGVRGSAVLRSTNAGGLKLDTVHIGVTQALIGPLTIKDLAIDYTAAGDHWSGRATLGLPPTPGGLEVKAAVEFAAGKFRSGTISVPLGYPGIQLGTWPAYLARAGGDFALDPLRIGLNATVGVLPVPPSKYAFRLDGQLKVTFSDPVKFELHGQGSLYDFRILGVDFVLDSDGYAKLHGDAGIHLVGASIDAKADMFVDVPSRTFSADVVGQGCVAGLCLFKTEAVVSSKGLGICVTAGVDHGAGYLWGHPLTDVDIDLFSCHMSRYEVAAPPGKGRAVAGGPAVARSAGSAATADGAPGVTRAVPPGGAAFTVGKGTSVENVRIEGAGGALTKVALISPAGTRIEPVTDPKAPEGTKVFAAYPDGGTTGFVGLKDPAPGVWQVVPLDGQPAVAQIAQSHAVPPPRVTAKVGGKARRRTLAYRTTTGDDLRTTFVETGPMGSRRLGVAKGAKGTLRFSPATGPAGTRRIEAIVERGGVPELRTVVATYKAPKAGRPGRVRGVRLARGRHAVKIRWKRVDGAARYAVRVDLPDGRRILRLARPTRLTVGGVPRKGRVRVRVQALDDRGKAGRAGTAAAGR